MFVLVKYLTKVTIVISSRHIFLNGLSVCDLPNYGLFTY